MCKLSGLRCRSSKRTDMISQMQFAFCVLSIWPDFLNLVLVLPEELLGTSGSSLGDMLFSARCRLGPCLRSREGRHLF